MTLILKKNSFFVIKIAVIHCDFDILRGFGKLHFSLICEKKSHFEMQMYFRINDYCVILIFTWFFWNRIIFLPDFLKPLLVSTIFIREYLKIFLKIGGFMAIFWQKWLNWRFQVAGWKHCRKSEVFDWMYQE